MAVESSDYLLFYDTFTHDLSEDQLRVDMVKFTLPVRLSEIRIVPKNCPPHANLSAFDKLGKTTPTKFKLDIYSNDSSNPLAPTFNPLGSIDFKDDCLSLRLTSKVSCDMVVVRGHYSMLSLCLYGLPTPPKVYTVPSFNKGKTSRSPSPYGERSADDGFRRKRGHSPEGGGASERGGSPRSKPKEEWSSLLDFFEPFSPDHSPEHSFDLYDDDIPPAKRGGATDAGYEEFSDEEIAFAEEEFEIQEQVEFDNYSEDNWMATTNISFNPFHTELNELESFPSLYDTAHEALVARRNKTDNTPGTRRGTAYPDEGTRLKEQVLKLKDANTINFKWIDSMEELIHQLYPGLAQLYVRSVKDASDSLQCICDWVSVCLNDDVIKSHPPPLNVRILKLGLRLGEAIATLSNEGSNILIKQGIIERLCDIISSPSHFMPSSIKLTCIHFMSTFLDYPSCMEAFLGLGAESEESCDSHVIPDGHQTPYRRLLEVVLSNQTSRVQVACSILLRKGHLYEMLTSLKNAVDQVVIATPVNEAPPLNNEDTPLNNEDTPLNNENAPLNNEDAPLNNEEEMKTDLLSDEKNKEGEGEEEKMEVEKKPEEEQVQTKEESNDEINMDTNEGQSKGQPLSLELVKTISSLLNELHHVINGAESNLMLHPLKSFPIKGTSGDHLSQDVFVGVARMLKHTKFLECLLVLLTAPSLVEESSVFSAIRSHLLTFLTTCNGLLYLSSCPHVTNAIIKVLIQSVESDVPLDELQPLTDFVQADSSDLCTPFNLGMLLVHHLQVLQSLDSLRQTPKQTMTDLESSDNLSCLHTLFSMTLFPIGKCAVTYILAFNSLFNVLLPFIEPRGYKEHDGRLARSSISSRYAAVLILKVLQNSCNLSFDFLTSHSRRLLSMSEFFKDNQSLTMSALYSWLHPLKHLGEATPISLLMGVVKENISKVNCNKPLQGSAAIITCLRLILTRCSSAPHLNNSAKNSCTLQQREAIVTLFSCGAMETITNLIQKVSDVISPLWSHKHSIGTNNSQILDILVSFALRLLKLLLIELLEKGSFQFRDTRVLQALFSLHTVMCSASHSGVFQLSEPETRGLIIDCLVTFTKPETIQDEKKDSTPSPDNSSWCLLLSEVISYTVSKPQAYLSGLMLLSSLLPLPLPFQSSESLSFANVDMLVKLRHLWACHLIPLSSQLTSLIETLLPSMCLTLQQVLRRFCAQLLDLAPSLALSITKIICSHLLVKIDSQDDESGKEIDNTSTEKKETLSPLVMTLTLCSVLVSQPMFKASLLTLISTTTRVVGGGEGERGEGEGGKEEEEEEEGYSRFIPLLLFLVQKKETVVPAKLCVMTILQSLVNVYITLSRPVEPVLDKEEREEGEEDDDCQLPLQQLSNSLPSLPQLEHIISAVLNHLGSLDQPLSTIAIGLKIISSSCQHMAGLTALHTLLPSSIKRLETLLKRLISTIKDSTPPSSEALQCVSLFLDMLSDLAAPDSSLSLSIPLPLVKCAVWDEEKESDLLLELQSVIKDSYKTEEGGAEASLIDNFTVPITEMSELLTSVTPDLSIEAPPILELPYMESVERQFLSRPNVTEGELSSSPEFWLATPPHNEADLEPETVTVNLEEIAKESCSNFNLQEEVKKQFLPSPPSSPVKHERKKKIIISGPEAQRRLKEAIQQRRIMGRGRDLFRNRKQNTSRPPSMHVDDFMTNSRGSSNTMVRGGLSRGVIRGRDPGMPLSSGYIMPPPHLMTPQLSGRWMTAPNIYSRGSDIHMTPSWESRTRQFLASVNKPEPMRSVWSHVMQDPYSRARGARMVEMMSYTRPHPQGKMGSGRMSSSSSRHN